MRILYSTHMAPPYIDPAPWAVDQVTCGPGWNDGPRSLRTARANYDLAEVVDRLPDGWRPDVFIAYVDSHGLAVPRNVAALRCPKIVVVGDVHHGAAPIGKTLNYLKAERFDLVVVLPTRQSCHWFTEAAVGPVVHCGAEILVRPYCGELVPARFPVIGFAGQAGPQHPRRRRLIENLAARGLPVHAGDASQEVALRKWAKCQLSFNCSLNGDVNMRTYEILSAGGCLFTDRLGVEAGVDFVEEREVIFYDGPEDCLERAAYWLARPDECLAIGLRGRAAFAARHSPAAKMAQVLAVLDGEMHPSLVAPAAVTIGSNAPSLRDRVAAYEILQECHRVAERLNVVFAGPGSEACALDASDLGRMTCRLKDLKPMPAGDRAARLVVGGGAVPVDILVTTAPLQEVEAARVLTVGGLDIPPGWRVEVGGGDGAALLCRR
jgi:hypothetical protein